MRGSLGDEATRPTPPPDELRGDALALKGGAKASPLDASTPSASCCLLSSTPPAKRHDKMSASSLAWRRNAVCLPEAKNPTSTI